MPGQRTNGRELAVPEDRSAELARRAGRIVRTVGHPTVSTLAQRGYDRIAADDDLTPGQAIGATIGLAVLEVLGHVAVEAVAERVERRSG